MVFYTQTMLLVVMIVDWDARCFVVRVGLIHPKEEYLIARLALTVYSPDVVVVPNGLAHQTHVYIKPSELS